MYVPTSVPTQRLSSRNKAPTKLPRGATLSPAAGALLTPEPETLPPYPPAEAKPDTARPIVGPSDPAPQSSDHRIRLREIMERVRRTTDV
jgi:hypothetical protein